MNDYVDRWRTFESLSLHDGTLLSGARDENDLEIKIEYESESRAQVCFCDVSNLEIQGSSIPLDGSELDLEILRMEVQDHPSNEKIKSVNCFLRRPVYGSQVEQDDHISISFMARNVFVETDVDS